MRTTYVLNDEGKLILRDSPVQQDRVNAPMIMKPLESFTSPIDGQVITSRKQLSMHNKQHGVTNSADYNGGYIERKAKERVRAGQEYLKATRRTDLHDAFNKHT